MSCSIRAGQPSERAWGSGKWSTYRANSGIAKGATLARCAGDMETLLFVGLHRKSRLSSFRGMRYEQAIPLDGDDRSDVSGQPALCIDSGSDQSF